MSALHTLGRWPTDRAMATPDRAAIDDRGVVVSYRDLERRSAPHRGLADGLGKGIAQATGATGDQHATACKQKVMAAHHWVLNMALGM